MLHRVLASWCSGEKNSWEVKVEFSASLPDLGPHSLCSLLFALSSSDLNPTCLICAGRDCSEGRL